MNLNPSALIKKSIILLAVDNRPDLEVMHDQNTSLAIPFHEFAGEHFT